MMEMPKSLVHAVMTLSLAFAAIVVPLKAAAVTSADLPEIKRSRAGLYLEAKDVPAFIDQHGGLGKVLFVDIRTRAEAMYVGMPTGVDALVPFVDHAELMTDWDAQRNIYRLEPFQDFVPEMQRRLGAKTLSKDDYVVLICRSGDRSARAANRLAEDGFTHVYSVVDGFEGDMSKDGRRSVNGWKNAGLPWSYKLDKDKMYFPK
jgi:rhodanese-related sulfurtransferase